MSAGQHLARGRDRPAVRGRNFTAYAASSYSAMAMLARMGFLHFCRVKNVVRNGRIVLRHVDGTTDPEEKE